MKIILNTLIWGKINLIIYILPVVVFFQLFFLDQYFLNSQLLTQLKSSLQCRKRYYLFFYNYIALTSIVMYGRLRYLTLILKHKHVFISNALNNDVFSECWEKWQHCSNRARGNKQWLGQLILKRKTELLKTKFLN